MSPKVREISDIGTSGLSNFVRDFLPEKFKQSLRNYPFRSMHCPGCKKTIEAAAWWTPDEQMVDWYCPDSFDTLETKVMDPNRKLVDYLLKIWREEFSIG